MTYQIIVFLLLVWHFWGDDMGAAPGLIFIGTLCLWATELICRIIDWALVRVGLEKYYNRKSLSKTWLWLTNPTEWLRQETIKLINDHCREMSEIVEEAVLEQIIRMDKDG